MITILFISIGFVLALFSMRNRPVLTEEQYKADFIRRTAEMTNAHCHNCGVLWARHGSKSNNVGERRFVCYTDEGTK